MLLHLDIWYEILSHLEYPQDLFTLRSLAVTSRSLSNLALDVMWRDGKSIRQIVSIINSFVPSRKEPFLIYYVVDDWMGDYGDTEDDDSSTWSCGSEEQNWVGFCSPSIIKLLKLNQLY